MVLESTLTAAAIITLVVALLQLVIWASTTIRAFHRYLRKSHQLHDRQDEELALVQPSSRPTGTTSAEHVEQTGTEISQITGADDLFPIERGFWQTSACETYHEPVSTNVRERNDVGIASMSENQEIRRRRGREPKGQLSQDREDGLAPF